MDELDECKVCLRPRADIDGAVQKCESMFNRPRCVWHAMQQATAQAVAHPEEPLARLPETEALRSELAAARAEAVQLRSQLETEAAARRAAQKLAAQQLAAAGEAQALAKEHQAQAERSQATHHQSLAEEAHAKFESLEAEVQRLTALLRVQPQPGDDTPDPKPPSGWVGRVVTWLIARRLKLGSVYAALVTAGVAVMIVLASGLSAYLYWAGNIGDRQGSVQASVNAELGKKRLSNIKVSVAKDWKTVAAGIADSQAEKDQALALIKKHGKLELIDNIRIKPSRSDLEQQLNQELANAGMKVTAQLDEGFNTVKLKHAGLSQEDRAKAEKLVTSNIMVNAGVADVKVVDAATVQKTDVPTSVVITRPPVDSAQIENGLNKRLRGAGLGTVSARVDENGIANLKGTVATREEKDKAVTFARLWPGVAGVGDVIHVTPPKEVILTPTPAPAPNPTTLEGEINRALRNGGAGGVTAQVSDDFSVTLKGWAISAAQKDRAFQIARQFKGVDVVKDRIFVVEQ